MIIKGFENEDIEVSEFGEWVGNDYIDYKSDYKEHQKIINDLLKQRQELIDYLKQEQDRLARECSPIYEDGLGKTILVNEDIYNEVNKILSKIEKE